MKKKEKKEVALDFSGRSAKINGKHTFIGVLQEYLSEINKRWKSIDTLNRYYTEYNTLIFPLLEEKPLEEYSAEEFADIIDDIRKRGKTYAESTINHFKYLIRVVTKTAAEKGICSDVLWGTTFVGNGEEEPEPTPQIRAKLRKSLTPQEEETFFKETMLNPLEAGETLGIAFMFAIGTRNQEACGFNYEHLQRALQYDFFVMVVAQTTKGGTSVVKSGGKTVNAPRILPIPDFFAKLLLKRKAYLQDLIDNGMLEGAGPGTEYETADKLPIVCRGNRFAERCRSSDLTKAAKDLFKMCKMDERVMSEISRIIENRPDDPELPERDPTAYLLRRNFATWLEILDTFSDEDQEYLMGHELEYDNSIRDEYTNTDILYELKMKLDERWKMYMDKL